MRLLSGSKLETVYFTRPAPFEPASLFFGPVRAICSGFRARRSLLCPRFGFFSRMPS